MSGELNIHLATGLTIKAIVWGEDRTTRWNGSAMVAASAISDANWATGMITCTEQQTSDASGTGTYVGDFPAGITTAGEYAIEYYTGASPTPGQNTMGVQTVHWSGAAVVNTDIDAKAVWDRVITKANHNIANSAGKKVRETADSIVIYAGDVVSSTANTIVLDSGASSLDGAYDPAAIVIVSGLGSGQVRHSLEYFGSSRTAIVDRDWKVQPDATSEFVLQAVNGAATTNEGRLRAATGTTAQLNALASTVDDIYNGETLQLVSGTGQDQSRSILDYDGATQTVTVDAFTVTPDATTGYKMLPIITDKSTLATEAKQDTLLARIGAFTGTGVNTVLGFLKAMASKAATLPSDIGGTYDVTTDSLEALRESQDTLSTDIGDVQTDQTTLLNRVGAFTGTGVNTILGFLKAMTSKVATLPSDIGGTYDVAADSLEAIRDRGDAAWTSSDTGSGAWTVTITVNDGTDPLENATVCMTNGGESYTATTNVSGQCSFSLDSATWNVAITKATYSFTPTTLAVSADTSQTYSMTAVSIPASNPGFVTGYFYCYDEDGIVEEGASVSVKIHDLPGTGISADTKVRTETSDATGLVSFTNMFIGAQYKIRRGDERPWKTVEIPASATDPYAIPNVLGLE